MLRWCRRSCGGCFGYRAAVTLKAVLLGGAVIPVELTGGPASKDSLLVRVWAHGFVYGNGKGADGLG